MCIGVLVGMIGFPLQRYWDQKRCEPAPIDCVWKSLGHLPSTLASLSLSIPSNVPAETLSQVSFVANKFILSVKSISRGLWTRDVCSYGAYNNLT